MQRKALRSTKLAGFCKPVEVSVPSSRRRWEGPRNALGHSPADKAEAAGEASMRLGQAE